MLPRPIIALLEAWMIQQLLRTPGFHRMAQRVAKTVHRAQHGTPADELGGTKLDSPEGGNSPGFIKHFVEEIRGQLGAAEKEEMRQVASQARVEARRQGLSEVEAEENAEVAWRKAEQRLRRMREEKEGSGKRVVSDIHADQDADAAWKETSKTPGKGDARGNGGFLDEYMEALREQVRQNKKDG
ncbi:hypothetical protein TI39_contig336g00053 [Zymoseptoria brevis]|uniref:Uncharacterized protein n=1 Tax=Zymoseptoria brevis TaxID=1047168 RepID=A0A0F4GS55_9PEZI|nr:hypothetical protein TI39_contig336g00053 [Zymoseptoria brevis]